MAERSALSRHRAGAPLNGGFAYLLVLLALALIGLGLVRGAELYVTATQREHERQLLAIGDEFRAAIQSYYQATAPTPVVLAANRYPTSLQDLVLDNRFPGIKRHLRKIYVDPMTGNSNWGLITLGDRIVGVRSLSDKTAIKQASFESDDYALAGKTKIGDWWFTYPPDLGIQAGMGGQLTPGTSPLGMTTSEHAPP